MATAFDRVIAVVNFNTESPGTVYTVPAGKYAFMYVSNIESGNSLNVNPGGGSGGGGTFIFVKEDIEGYPTNYPRRVGSLEVPLYAGDVVSVNANTNGTFVTGVILVFNLP
jgi:hypothetical protein